MTQLISDWGLQNLQFEESKGRLGILGTVKGDFFFANTPSRNSRKYPAECWEKVQSNEDIQRLIKDRLMYGTIGHVDKDMDSLLREGLASHLTTKFGLLEDRITGYGEADILDSPVGRILNSVIRSGSKLSISSKANGDYKGKDENGVDEVDPEKFIFERFDFVIDPGFLKAKPQLQEALNEAFKDTRKYVFMNNSNNGGDKMSQELLEKLTREKLAIEEQFSSLSKEYEAIKKANESQEEVVKQFKDIQPKYEASVDELNKLKKELEPIGEPASIFQALKLSKQALKEYVELGDANSIRQALMKSRELGEQLKEHGGLGNIIDVLTRTKSIFETIKEKFGSIPQIENALISSKNYIQNTMREKREQETSELSAKYGVDESKVKTMLNKMSKSEVESLLEDLRGSKKRSVNDGKLDESKMFKSTLSENRVDKFFKGMR